MTATWSNELHLVAPGPLASLLSGLDDLATAANATLDAAGTALDAAKVFLAGAASPQAAAAAALVTQAQGIVDDIFRAGLYRLVVHPWLPGVGFLPQRGRRAAAPASELYRSLSFPNAVRAIAASFDDLGDARRPQFSSAAPLDMIVLIAGGPSPSIFQAVLEALAALIGAKELLRAWRRMQQLLRLEATRFARPRGSKPPDWERTEVLDLFPALAPLHRALAEQLAMLKGYAAGGSKSVNVASQLIAAKRAQLTALQNQLNAALALFGQGLANAGVYALWVSGTGGSAMLKSTLRSATGGAGPELSFCVGMAWVGPQGSLSPIKNIMGL